MLGYLNPLAPPPPPSYTYEYSFVQNTDTYDLGQFPLVH